MLAIIAASFEPSALHAETLPEAITMAYGTNPAIQSDRALTRASQEGVAQAKAVFGPQLDASASYGYQYQKVKPDVLGNSVDGFNSSYQVSLDQQLFTSGRLTAGLRGARAANEVAAANERASVIDVLSNVVTAYAAVLRDQELVAIARDNVDLLSGRLAETEARYKARYATATSLDQTRSRLLTGQAQLDIAKGNLQQSRNFYRRVVGQYPGELAPLPPLPGLPATVAEAQEIADANNPALVAERAREAITRADLAAARAERGPQVALTGSLARSPLTIGNDSRYVLGAQALVTASMPIFTSGLITARVREALARDDAQNQLVELRSREVRDQIASLWSGLSAARRALPQYLTAVDAARAALEGARVQERAGQLTSLDVLINVNDLLSARVDAATTHAQIYTQQVQLLAALGLLSVSDFTGEAPAPTLSYEATLFAGLPTAPIVRAADSVLYDDHQKLTPVAKEHDEEPGHEMAPLPASATGSVQP